MLVLSGMVLFVPTNIVQAIDPIETGICFSPTTGDMMKRAMGVNTCPAGYNKFEAKTAAKGACKEYVINERIWKIWAVDPDPVTGSYQNSVVDGKCIYEDNDPIPFVSFTSMKVYDPNASSNSNTNTNTKPGTGNSNGNTNKPPKQIQGNCEEGFHKVGPLCVPNSPFEDPNAPVNSPDAGGLAVKLIRILLYFAGIVAVIMAIIGGYQIMTAAGNATQAANGRKTLTNAIIGLIIVILSYFIIQAVVSFVTKG
jgi:hypothetical protein